MSKKNRLVNASNGNNGVFEKPHDIVLTAKNESQKSILKSIKDNTLTIISGPPGSGKTHIPVVYGLQQVLRGNYSRLIFTRPCVEAYGENLGFLPGDFNDKIAPYMIAIFDILTRVYDKKKIEALFSAGVIQTIPLAFQRGITFQDAFVVGDEFQNTIPQQVRMFLTRMGENCKIVITGDPAQTDINGTNGLVDVMSRLENSHEDISIIHMNYEDVVRHPLVEFIDRKYAV